MLGGVADLCDPDRLAGPGDLPPADLLPAALGLPRGRAATGDGGQSCVSGKGSRRTWT